MLHTATTVFYLPVNLILWLWNTDKMNIACYVLEIVCNLSKWIVEFDN